MVKLISRTFSLLHLTSVFAVAYLIVKNPDGEAIMLWLIYMFIDFPIAYLMVPLAYVVDTINFISRVDAAGNYSIYRDVANFWYPAIFTGVIGTYWWYKLPFLLVKFFRFIFCHNNN
ncbi:MAG: hypothetical protein ACI86X_002397 [Moritella sp.]|jgi:hypothetical protein